MFYLQHGLLNERGNVDGRLLEKQDTRLYTSHVKDEIERQGSEGNADVIKALSPTGQSTFPVN